MGTSWRDDGTLPPPASPRDIPAIVSGVDQLRGRGERVAYVAGLLEAGEWDKHGVNLVFALASAWELSKATVREYAQQARALAALNPATRAGVVARLLAKLERAERHAYGDPHPAPAARAAVAAVVAQAKVLGIVVNGAPPPAPPPPDDLEDPSTVPLESVTCGACEGQSFGDPPPRFCAHCGAAVEGAAP